MHQRGPYAATAKLIKEISNAPNDSVVPQRILQLMPCFSLPQYAYFHGYNVEIYMLECTKRFEETEFIGDWNSTFVEESDEFHKDPLIWLQLNWQRRGFDRVDIILVFESTYKKVKMFLDARNFKQIDCTFHTQFIVSSWQDNHIVTLRRINKDV